MVYKVCEPGNNHEGQVAQYSGSFWWLGEGGEDGDATEPPSLGTPPGVLLLGLPLPLGAGLLGCVWWNSLISEGSRMSSDLILSVY